MFQQMYYIFLAILLSVAIVDSKSWIPEDREPSDDTDGGGQGSNDRFQNEMLQAHNDYRARHCVPALELDDRLNQLAQDAAQELLDSNGEASGDTKGLGRNLYTKSGTGSLGIVRGEQVTKEWYNGIRNYDFEHGGFSSQGGSFTQVVWKASRKLGVGIAYSSDGQTAYVVAYYSPPGNFNNEFEQNVLPQC